jgi:predicted nucleic acid-binding protein
MFHPAKDQVSYSSITRCELFAGRDAKEEGLRQLLAPFDELGVTREIAERAGRLRRSGTMRTPDALIAATALDRALTLITRNQRDFAGIVGLKVKKPVE